VTRVLLCHQPTDGGVGRHVRDLTEGLAERGYEVTLCSPAPPAGLGAAVRHVPLDLRRAVAPRADAAALAGLARTIARVRPDVVHAHSSKAGALARLARMRHPRLPVLYSPHGYAFAGHFSRPAERAAYRAIEAVLAPLASRVVCVCEAEARLARSIGPSARVRVVHNGIGPPPPGPPDLRLAGLRQQGPVIGALTLLRPGKGLETLIDAAPRILERHPRARIAIVGEGPDLAALRARAAALGVAEAVSFPGPSPDPYPALRAFDVFVHPSWAESFPYVVLEAMSLARPILASDVGGIGEALAHGESGLLAPPRDTQALAQALIELLDDPARAAMLGRAALARVSARFTRESMIEGVAGVYEEVAPRAP
jgi:glycosyltransferase involved in cell wall biosynthesis